MRRRNQQQLQEAAGGLAANLLLRQQERLLSSQELHGGAQVQQQKQSLLLEQRLAQRQPAAARAQHAPHGCKVCLQLADWWCWSTLEMLLKEADGGVSIAEGGQRRAVGCSFEHGGSEGGYGFSRCQHRTHMLALGTVIMLFARHVM